MLGAPQNHGSALLSARLRDIHVVRSPVAVRVVPGASSALVADAAQPAGPSAVGRAATREIFASATSAVHATISDAAKRAVPRDITAWTVTFAVSIRRGPCGPTIGNRRRRQNKVSTIAGRDIPPAVQHVVRRVWNAVLSVAERSHV